MDLNLAELFRDAFLNGIGNAAAGLWSWALANPLPSLLILAAIVVAGFLQAVPRRRRSRARSRRI